MSAAVRVDAQMPESYVNLAMVHRSLEDEEREAEVLQRYIDRFGADLPHSEYAAERLAELATNPPTIE